MVSCFWVGLVNRFALCFVISHCFIIDSIALLAFAGTDSEADAISLINRPVQYYDHTPASGQSSTCRLAPPRRDGQPSGTASCCFPNFVSTHDWIRAFLLKLLN